MEEILRKLREAREATGLFLLQRDIERKVAELAERESRINEAESELTNEVLNRAHAVEFNSQSYASFYSTKLEKDKSLLTLSVAGIGFLISFISFAAPLNSILYSMFIVAAISFLVCIYLIVKIFDENAEYIIRLVTDDDGYNEPEARLKKLDRVAIMAFYIGILVSFGIGASYPLIHYDKGVTVAEKKDDCTLTKESFAGMATVKKSFTDASKLKPQNIGSGSAGNSSGNSSSGTQGDKK